MAGLGQAILSFFLSLLSASAVDLESAFLQNRPELLLRLVSSRTRIGLTLPAPIAFSDQISSEQFYFLFQDILSRCETLEFYPESGLPPWLANDRIILKARWSFRDRKTENQHALRLFILFRLEKSPPLSPGRSGTRAAGTGVSRPWKILEIKAEKI